MKFHDVALDGSTERLIAAARATHATEALPTASGKALLASARGVRLYLEARQSRLACGQLEAIEGLMATCDDANLRAAYETLVGDVRKAIGKQAARVAAVA
jgi:hypothetical protein